jgi:glycosyltransferase involved in cell wall biosynthesis
MRAAIFADQLFYDQPGGIGTYLRHLVPGLAGCLEGGSLVIVHHGPQGEGIFPGLAGVEELRIGARRDITGMEWHCFGHPHLEHFLGRLDLVHAPSLVFPPSRAPLAATVHDLCILKYPGAFPTHWRLFHRRGLSLILREASVILTDSDSTRRDLRSLTGRKDPRVRVVPLGVDVPEHPGEAEVEKVLAKHKLSPGFILYVGTVEPRKNLSRLVEAYAAFGPDEKRKSGELVLVGAPGWMGRKELARIVSQAGVRWLGYLPQPELEAVYRAASIFVYPSLYEGFGLPVLEAMARGIPVVTSDSSSMREMGEGVAMLVDPTDARELGKALRRLIYNEGMRGELAEKGLERAAEYPWQRTVDLTWEAYGDALG